MFLKQIQKRNKALLAASVRLHQEGKILPNTYVVDLDAVSDNATLMKAEADKHNIELYQMTKQFGRNPLVIKAIQNAGIPKIVCVDFAEALFFIDKGFKIGNVGHLVQMPTQIIDRVLAAKPDVVTIFTLYKAKEINAVAQKRNLVQNVILRVWDEEDTFYYGQEGGFALKTLTQALDQLVKLKNIKIIGFTSFPTFLYGKQRKQIEPTNNLKTMQAAAKIAKCRGFNISHLNAPSTNCVSILAQMGQLGMTHGEPGHALIGTMPANAYQNEPEKPAIVYVSEIAHLHLNKAYIYGGGYYPRGKIKAGMIFNGNKIQQVKINRFDGTYIDYYLNFDIKPKWKIKIGASIVMAFRTQVFTTRAHVAIVSGLNQNQPKLQGIYTSQGEKIPWL